jgi:hypothetical protein
MGFVPSQSNRSIPMTRAVLWTHLLLNVVVYNAGSILCIPSQSILQLMNHIASGCLLRCSLPQSK